MKSKAELKAVLFDKHPKSAQPLKKCCPPLRLPPTILLGHTTSSPLLAKLFLCPQGKVGVSLH